MSDITRAELDELEQRFHLARFHGEVVVRAAAGGELGDVVRVDRAALEALFGAARDGLGLRERLGELLVRLECEANGTRIGCCFPSVGVGP
jgi:hypothetical protein